MLAILKSTSQDILKSVNDDGINLAIWKRPIDLRCDKILERMLCSDEEAFIDTNPNQKRTLSRALLSLLAMKYHQAFWIQDIGRCISYFV